MNQIVNMTLEELKQFLRSKPGYLKKGGRSLKNLLLERGLHTTIAECKIALRQVKEETKELKNKIKTNSAKVLIYDIETSYNVVSSWRIGYNINLPHYSVIKERAIICVSYKWLGEDQVYNLTWDKNQDDKFLVEQFVEVLNEADLIVAHNGDRFDLKWIKTRALKHDIQMLVDYKQFDTLKVAKKKFYFNSNKLDYISEFLGFGNKLKTEPELWDRVILEKDPDALQEMLDYCDEDVILLEKVYNKLVHWENPKYHQGVLDGKTKVTSPISGGLNLKHVKSITTNRGTIKHVMKDLDTDRFFEMSDTNYKKFQLLES